MNKGRNAVRLRAKESRETGIGQDKAKEVSRLELTSHLASPSPFWGICIFATL